MELRLSESISDIPAAQWDALHDGRNPFVSHAFLAGLESTGCLNPRLGWEPLHAALHDGERLVAAAPAYRKSNSHGEFVFDHAWAHAYTRAGLEYYPKWLVGVPYSPVPGPRLLACNPPMRATLAAAMAALFERVGCSSLHVNFVEPEQLEDFGSDWLARADVQFHWRRASDWHDFDDFLGAMTSRRRKTIRAERAQVARTGVRFRCVSGHDAGEADLQAMHGFYCATQQDKGNRPALTLKFFRHLASALPDALRIVLAERDGAPLAGALFLRGPDTLYGRYWGADEVIPGLHFETCYYQGIELGLREGLQRFEPGAQGEHKVARGFLPVLTHSRHRVADPRFAEALAPWCAEERTAALHYRDAVLAHSPFRADAAPDADAPAPPRS